MTKMTESLPASFRTALQNPACDVMDSASIFYVVYGKTQDKSLKSSGRECFGMRMNEPPGP